MQPTALCVYFFALLLLAASPAQAHFPWLYVLGENPLRFEVGWGHEFPRDRIMEPARIASLHLSGADGVMRQIPVSDQPAYDLGESEAPGAYLLAAQQVPGFYSRSPQGGRRVSKAEFPEAESCSRSNNAMKALVVHGAGGDPSRILGHPLEIVPLADPTALGPGDAFPVKVLYRGEPYQGTVEAAREGYPDQDAAVLRTATDASGVARIPLSAGGVWLVMVNHREPYPDPQVCDEYSYTATLTFRAP